MSAEEVKQAPVVVEPSIEESVAPPAPEVAKEEPKVEAAPPAPEDVAATTVVEPLKDDVNKQPTITHTEAGNAHTDSEPATTVDGTPADKPAEEAAASTPAEGEGAQVKEDKKAAVKEKVEKTKSEGKGLFARIFGSKDKSPKAKKVKTPKTEKADPTPALVAEEPAPVAETTEAPVAEGSAAAPVLAAPVAIEPSVAENVPVVAEPAPEVEAAKETETTAAPAEAAPAPETPAKDEPVKSPKPNRRLSARITGFLKHVGKKEHPSQEESHKNTAETAAEEPASVSEVAPKIEEPSPSEPLKIEEPVATSSAPPPAPVVSATA